MNKKYFLVLLILIAVTQQGFSRNGKTGWSIFRKARSPKFKSITVTPVMAVRGDLSGVFYNPAILALNMHKEIFFFSEMGLVNDVFGGIVYGHPLEKSSIAGGFIYYNAGKMYLNWLEDGDLKTEEVTAQSDILGIVSYGRMFTEKLSLGAILKFASSSLFGRESAAAFAADIGTLYFPPIENLSICGAIQNLGTSSKFVEKSNPLPFSAFLALGYFLGFNKFYVTPGVDITYLIAEERTIPEIGFEAGVNPISINLGYRFSDEANWHFGFTFFHQRFDIAYAFLPGVYLKPTHRISIGYRFGK